MRTKSSRGPKYYTAPVSQRVRICIYGFSRGVDTFDACLWIQNQTKAGTTTVGGDEQVNKRLVISQL